MGSIWATLKLARAGAFFGQALERSRNTRQNNQGGILSSRLLFPGIILVTTAAMTGKVIFNGIAKTYHKHQDRKAQREHDRAMIEKAKIENGQDQSSNEQINPTSNDQINPMPNNNSFQPQSQFQQTNNGDTGQVTIINPSEQDKPKSDNPFENDIMIGQDRFYLEKSLKVMKLKTQSPETDQYYAQVATAGSEPTFYITGSGIYDKNHQPYYKLGFEKDRTLYLDRLLELINEHEYSDMLTLFELFENK